MGGMDGVRGIAAWRWLFILEGVFTVCVAIGAFFSLPNYPNGMSELASLIKLQY